MSKYSIGYTATNGPGQIDMDGSNDRMQLESTEGAAASAASVKRKGQRYSYQLTYDCNPEEMLDRYLAATVTTRIIRTDWETGEQKELFTKNRPYPMVHQVGPIFDGRWLVQIALPGFSGKLPGVLVFDKLSHANTENESKSLLPRY